MERIINDVNKGVPTKTSNRRGKKGYWSIWLASDDTLHYLYEFPEEALYLFTDNEYERFILRQKTTASSKLFSLGVLNFFILPRPCIVLKLSLGGREGVVHIPIGLARRALKRGSSEPNSSKGPGLINRVVGKVSEVLKK